LAAHASIFDKIREEISKTIIGQDDVIELLLVAMLSEGHAILEGVPGLAKTLIVNSLAKTMDLSFNRIQFTPDMVPSDITGTEIVSLASKGERDFRFIEGPVFSNIILADEINRTPPKTQSALLQAMQERQVTILGKTYELPSPFFVLATQNPIEYEGTYPLPEAQLDRFLLYIYVNYPSKEEEMAIIEADPRNLNKIRAVVSPAELNDMIKNASKQAVSDVVKDYAVNIVRNTRPDLSKVSLVGKYVEWGAGPRASQMLVRLAKSFSFMKNKKIVDKQDIDAVLVPCLKHRIVLNYNAVSDGVSVDEIIREVQIEVEKKL
jgi:MoxR-like ATPase